MVTNSILGALSPISFSSRLDEIIIGHKRLAEWDKEWKPIGKLADINLGILKGKYGVYRGILNYKIVYLGVASEYKKGLKKRLNDYIRKSDSGRNFDAGRKMHKHKNEIDIEIIYVGDDNLSSIISCMLECPMIAKHDPRWNRSKSRQE